MTAPGQLAWSDTPVPRLQDAHAALVRPVVVATCDFDHLIVSGRAPVAYPVQIGHEMVAEVVDVGEKVQNVQPGDRVVVPFQVNCGSCAQCTATRTSCCTAVPWLSCYGLGAGAGDWGGAVSDAVHVPYADAMLLALPEKLAPEVAAAAGCNLTDAYRCVVPQLRDAPGSPVLIVANGFQNIGLMCVAFARTLGDASVCVFGLAPELERRARAMGATILDSAADIERHAYPIVVEASLDDDLLATALSATAPGGTCTISAMYTKPQTPVPMLDLFAACATIHTGQPHVRGLLPDVLALVALPTFPSGELVDAVHPWNEAITAFTSPGKHIITRP
ncbi:alcohol dehydrogenase catalytic domain-containing protein [Candidatus Mycolicibacterium alkanivorans]|uniref:Alcohol dehydrogenase catalytic domain-containing protein n=1 Tax=Candidatus Mycolicibacterium alkanivorans TaxID=2954114 RepID=A0ABS9YS52_9MYCO|nr:alcohol dehydrogenase catalytic domain-containing protein [Candidatus Mycolicibacterium alkanivorans]MCI4674068.1 alcohol dehydrogenase catalytic domain-containing protein [Candidatus Mycolicibacterium alkanivorans]